MIDVKEICSRAKEASYALSGYTSEQKNGMLDAIADALTEKAILFVWQRPTLSTCAKRKRTADPRLSSTGSP